MVLTYDAPRGGQAAPATSYGFTPAGIASFTGRDVVSHFSRLEQAISVALGSADYSDAMAWGDALGAVLMTLAGATAGAIMLPGPVVRWRLIPSPATDRVERRDHDEATERLGVPGERGRPDSLRGDAIGWSRDDVPSLETRSPAAALQPRCAIGIRVRTGDGTIAALYVRRDAALGPLEPQVIAAFRAIAPAFQAGVNDWLRLSASRANVEGMLASLRDAALLFDADGTPVYANAAIEKLGEQTAARVRDEAQRLAWALGAVARRSTRASGSSNAGSRDGDARSERTVRVGALVYRLGGSLVGEHLLGARPAVLVTVTSAASEPLTDDALHEQYGLTTREMQVARLIAEGLSNNEIAERLGVRFFTARNHVERALAKLGVTSRHRVGPLLRNETEAEGSNRAA